MSSCLFLFYTKIRYAQSHSVTNGYWWSHWSPFGHFWSFSSLARLQKRRHTTLLSLSGRTGFSGWPPFLISPDWNATRRFPITGFLPWNYPKFGFSDFTSTPSPDIPTSWSLVRNSVKPSDSPRSHPLSRILSSFMPLSHSFPTQKGRIKRSLRWAVNALYALSATHFSDKKKSPVEPDFFMGDFSKNSAYFKKSKLYFLKSKPYFF